MVAMLMLAVMGAAAMGSAVPRQLMVPDWDFVPEHTDLCVDATALTNPGRAAVNARWTTFAVPTGTPPANGWPVYLNLVTDTYPVAGKTCGSASGYVRKTYAAFATPKEAMSSCFGNNATLAKDRDASMALDNTPVGDACGDTMAASCASAARSGFGECVACAGAKPGPVGSKNCTVLEAYRWCKTNSGGHHPQPRGGCSYDQEAGELWDHRLKQYLLVNGVAVLNVNPIEEDSWDAFELAWNGYSERGEQVGGVDKPYLTELHSQIKAGKLGPLDHSKIVVRGWSSGAQMVSWLVQVQATDPTFPLKMAAGVMLSGGSYQCYNDAQAHPAVSPIGSCATCTEGGPSHCQGDPKCNSCDAAVQPYCQQCCPRNYTEQHYADHPDDYANHPPMFLAQTSTVDNHADLCACKHYHETLQSHSVHSVLALVPEEDEACFCVGNPNNRAAAGSPFAHKCNDPEWGKNCGTMGGQDCCISHTFGFADMIEPAVNFVLETTEGHSQHRPSHSAQMTMTGGPRGTRPAAPGVFEAGADARFKVRSLIRVVDNIISLLASLVSPPWVYVWLGAYLLNESQRMEG